MDRTEGWGGGGILSAGTFEINIFVSLEQTTSEEEQDLISGDR